MDKMKCETGDGVVRNVDKIAAMFPQVVTEVKGEDGKITRAVKWDVLKELLSGEYVEGGECYDFTWPGKRAAIAEAARPIRKTLRPCKAESKDWDTTENLYIEGDNLEVLKLLQESYLGKVKMIYIDPPYNTGNDSFIYNDDYAVPEEELFEAQSYLDEDGNINFKKNDRSNPRFHSAWCSMIYPRLILARDLLTDDGVIFISIDEKEVANLKKMCDEVFGWNNFIDIFNWAKTETPENLSKKSKQVIEYILCYQKNRDQKKFKGIKKTSQSANGLLNQPNAVSTLTFRANIVRTSIPNGIIRKGVYGTKSYIVELLEDTEVQDGVFVSPVKLKARFKWSQEYLENELKNGTVIKIPTMNFSPSYEKAEYDAEVPPNLINSKVNVGTNENAGEYQVQLFGKKVFNYPKPVSLITYLMGFNDLGENSIILDFFSGSGTTADAVMQLNANGESKKRFIMVQFPESLPVALERAKTPSEQEIIKNAIALCREMHFPEDICSVAKERIRRAGEKIKEEAGLAAANLDIGFRVFKVADSNMKDVYFSAAEYSQDMIDTLVSNIKEDRTDLDLLYGCLLEWGVELSLPHTSEKIDGVTVHTVNGGDLIACFDPNIPESAIRTIAKRQPLRAVFRDSSFASAPQKINVEEIFKLLSPTTTIKVI